MTQPHRSGRVVPSPEDPRENNSTTPGGRAYKESEGETSTSSGERDRQLGRFCGWDTTVVGVEGPTGPDVTFVGVRPDCVM